MELTTIMMALSYNYTQYVQVTGQEEATAALLQSAPQASRLAPAMKLTTLLLATLLFWVFFV